MIYIYNYVPVLQCTYYSVCNTILDILCYIDMQVQYTGIYIMHDYYMVHYYTVCTIYTLY